MAKRVDTKTLVTYGVLAVYAAASLFVRFSNPAMTETQLFIEFWPLWLFFAATLLGLAVWNNERP